MPADLQDECLIGPNGEIGFTHWEPIGDGRWLGVHPDGQHRCCDQCGRMNQYVNAITGKTEMRFLDTATVHIDPVLVIDDPLKPDSEIDRDRAKDWWAKLFDSRTCPEQS